MSNTCVTLLNPVDENRVRTLAKLAATAKARGLEVLLLGAFARDLHFWHTYGIECRRETMDVDTVVQMKDWAAYHEFRAALITVGFENEAEDHPEKLRDTTTGVIIDLLPFGRIAEDGQTIVWPEDNSRWSVVGIQDAYDDALTFQIVADGGAHIIRFITIPALVLLKIVAVYDRPQARHKKDTVDIGFVIEKYLATGNKPRLERHPHDDILRTLGPDLDRATAMLLGRDMSAMISKTTKAYVEELLVKESKSTSLCLFTKGIQSALCRGDFSRARTIVRDILDGLRWSPGQGN